MSLELAAVGAAIDAASALPAHTLPDDAARADLLGIDRLVSRLEALRVARVADLDSRSAAVPGYPRGGGAAAFERVVVRRAPGTAKQDVEVARALRGLPLLAAAFAAGEVSRAHVDVAVRALAKLPKSALDDDTRARADRKLAEDARQFDPSASGNLAKHLAEVVCPEAVESFDPEAFTRRGLSFIDTPDGMTLVRGQLPPAQAAVAKAAIEAAAKRMLRRSQADDPHDPERRGAAQIRADAFAELCAEGAAPARIVVHTDAERLAAVRDGRRRPVVAQGEHTGPLSPELFAQLTCGAVIETALTTPSGAVLNLGRAVREATGTQRRALVARDRACIVCAAPAERCQAHHVRWWSDQGPTDVTNMTLLCSRCHTLVHLGVWQVRMRDGVPEIYPPGWVPGGRRWLEPLPSRLEAAREGNQQIADDARVQEPEPPPPTRLIPRKDPPKRPDPPPEAA